jgi:putative transposase
MVLRRLSLGAGYLGTSRLLVSLAAGPIRIGGQAAAFAPEHNQESGGAIPGVQAGGSRWVRCCGTGGWCSTAPPQDAARRKDQVSMQCKDYVLAGPLVAVGCRGPLLWSGCCAGPLPLPPMPVARATAGPGPSVRLRPGGVQRLAAAEGRIPCCREKISDSEIQRRVITLAKQAPEREWLAGAPSVALVQACNDARRAYRNWFDFLSGKRHGRKVGHPRFRRKHGRQSIRLTRNGFTLRGERLYVAKVGEIRVRWSRNLASAPSSVTVIREPDGRYYASFVVEREAVPLPVSGHEIGLDVGLDRLAVTSDGEVIANPRFLRRRERRLARAQRTLSRRAQGSANWAKARHRVAVLHRKVRETRLDHAHKTALRLVRDNQAVYAEDLAMSGLARTRLAKSIYDAAWAQLLRLVAEKAEHHGRTFHRIGRFEPTSQMCSACGVKDGPKPLSVRTWTCTACSAEHDRDVNAAVNILAAGRADMLNACRAQVRPGPAPGTAR